MAYHLKPIPKGTYGDLSKIKEELLELEDSLEQHCNIMAAMELADLYGAIEGFALIRFGLTMNDLLIMSEITKRVFESGAR